MTDTPYELGRRAALEALKQHPLTDEQKRRMRALFWPRLKKAA
jgi:hypothetical protein